MLSLLLHCPAHPWLCHSLPSPGTGHEAEMPIPGAQGCVWGSLLCQGDADALPRQLGVQGSADSWGSVTAVTTAVLSPEDLLPAARKYGTGTSCSSCWRGQQEPRCHPGLSQSPHCSCLAQSPHSCSCPLSCPCIHHPGPSTVSPAHGDTCHLCHSLWGQPQPG